MIVVADSGPLHYLILLDHADLLHRFYDDVVVPEAVAAEVSTSPSKANGGLIGPFSHEDMSPQLLALVEKMKPGEITAPIRTPKGYQLFKLETLKAQALQPFDSVRDLIADKVAGARTQVEMKKFLTRLRAQAIIEWKNQELKKVYDKQVAAEPASSGGGQ